MTNTEQMQRRYLALMRITFDAVRNLRNRFTNDDSHRLNQALGWSLHHVASAFIDHNTQPPVANVEPLPKPATPADWAACGDLMQRVLCATALAIYDPDFGHNSTRRKQERGARIRKHMVCAKSELEILCGRALGAEAYDAKFPAEVFYNAGVVPDGDNWRPRTDVEREQIKASIKAAIRQGQ